MNVEMEMKHQYQDLKYTKLLYHIETLTKQSDEAKQELGRILNTTKSLKSQCSLQQEEINGIEQDKMRIQLDLQKVEAQIQNMKESNENLDTELHRLSAKNQQLRLFLEVYIH